MKMNNRIDRLEKQAQKLQGRMDIITPAIKHHNLSHAAYATAGCSKYFFTLYGLLSSVRINDSVLCLRSLVVLA